MEAKPKKKRRLKERLNSTSAAPTSDATERAAAASPANTSAAVGRPWTVSLALPGSIVDNAQSHELRSYLVGQVARAAASQVLHTGTGKNDG